MLRWLTLLLLSSISWAQGYNAYRNVTFSAATSDVGLKQSSLIGYHKLSWTPSGSPAACTVAIDSSANGSAWTAGGIITGQDCTTVGASAIIVGSAPYIRLTVTALTAATSVQVTYTGWVNNPSGSSSGACITTVAQLSTACGTTKGTLATVTDGTSGSDCAAGGGTSVVACVYNGTTWAYAGATGGSMVYPGAGVGNSTGAAWGTSYTVGTGANNLVQLNGSSQLPAISGVNLTALNASNLASGTVPAARLPNPSATTLGGVESLAVVSHKWINTISTSGVPAATQPACADVSDATASCSTDTTNAANISSGTLPAARLPNPSGTTLGGVQSLAAVSHKWINTISTSGVPAATQPACGDVSDASAWCNASYVVGVAPNNLVQLDASSRLPAVDGSQLTNVASTITGSTQYSIAQFTSVGTSNQIGGIAAPTAPSGVPQVLTNTNSGGAAAASIWGLPGVGGRNVSGTSDTILATDRAKWVTYSSASAKAVTLPQAGSTGFTSNFVVGLKTTGAGSVTVTPTTSTIDGAANIVIPQGQSCSIGSLDDTNYVTRCSSGIVTAGANITITPSITGFSIAAAASSGLANPGAAGIVSCPDVTCASTSARTITGTANLITISNGDGAAANPVITVGSFVNTASSPLVTDHLVCAAGNDRTTKECPQAIPSASVATMAANGTSGNLIQSAAADKTQSDAGIATANVTQTTATPVANQICVFGSTAKTCTPTTTLPTAAEPAHTGDVTNSAGSLATTIANSAVTGAKIANNTVTATQLAAQYSKGSCTEVWGGSGTSFALTSGDDAVSNNTCYNDSGVTRTITAVKCRSDNASNTTTVNPTFGSAGTGTTILSGALTCGSSLAYSSSGTISNASWTTGTGITPAMGGTLTGTSIALIVEYTF